VVAGEAFRYRLRCTLVVFWGEGAQEPWYLLTDLSWRGVCGCWYGYRAWIEQGFRWHGAWVFWVASVSCGFGGRAVLVVVGVGVGVFVGSACGFVGGGSEVGLWDRHRRSASVLLLGLMSLMVKCWRSVLSVESEIRCFCSGGEPK
jgi:hypothetical protein